MPIDLDELYKIPDDIKKRLKKDARRCYGCDKILYFMEFVGHVGNTDEAIKMWNAGEVEIYCCSCFNNKKREKKKIIETQIKTIIKDNFCGYDGKCEIRNYITKVIPPPQDLTLLPLISNLMNSQENISDNQHNIFLMVTILNTMQNGNISLEKESWKHYCRKNCCHYKGHLLNLPKLLTEYKKKEDGGFI